MGIDYNASIAFGYSYSADELKQIFSVHVPEESHLERRWDPKTGQELPKVKVVDTKEGTYLRFQGEEMMYLPELCEAICTETGCFYSGFNAYDEEPDTIVFGLVPKTKLAGGHDFGHVSSGDSYSMEDVLALLPQLHKLSDKLLDLGLRPKTLGVYSMMDVF